MERKEIRRVVASALAAVLIAPSFGSMTVAYAKEAQNPVNQETQMSSDKEVVYVNTYSDATVREQNLMITGNSIWGMRVAQKAKTLMILVGEM